jgi:hypothetical protein
VIFLAISFMCVSFLIGRNFGRSEVLEELRELAKRESMPQECVDWTFEHERLTRVLQWGIEPFPGLRYYGIQIKGFQLGFWSKRVSHKEP